MSHVRVGSIDLHYLEEGGGEAIVLVHGWRCGHFLQEDDPATLGRRIAQFLSEDRPS